MIDIDVLVIGGGMAGSAAAKAARDYGVSVALADPGDLGGT
ncbi:MAG: NAD(P)-binding protein [Firmicutes bacterium]|nr:NAD(P)-binding protein [Bacillota bacterium]